MNIILVRHGPAEDVGARPECRRDADRRLTPAGRRRVAAVARRLHALEIRPARWASSPLCRALETARLLAATLEPDADIVSLPALTLDGSLKDLFAWLNEAPTEDALLVGHQPDLAAFASLCLCGQPGLPLHLRKAGVGILRSIGLAAPGRCRLEAWYPPPTG
ncbi:MAG: histidine phosphatase family protein [Candidatus Marinimicrobia bacterium]|nr:histidine phosphatase family protein [Candidatus Neomarinimicrobiota bacterium]